MNATSSPPGPPPDEQSLDRRLTVLETAFHHVLPTLATKHDLSLLELRIGEEFKVLRSEIGEEFKVLRGENSRLEQRVGEEFKVLRSENSRLEVNIEKVRSDLQNSINSMQKWMAGLVVSVLISFVGTTVGFLNISNQISARLALAPNVETPSARPAQPLPSPRSQ
ncbi:MAG: hypothetical protein V4633_01850 [Pseudomonadota bacterium]